MSYCRRCRIVTEQAVQLCPLCGQQLQHYHQEECPQTLFPHLGQLKHAEDHPAFWYAPMPVSRKRVINLIIDFFILGAFGAILIVMSVDIYRYNLDDQTHFATYLPVISLVYTIILLLIFRFYRFTLAAQWLILLNTFLFLIGIDLNNHQLSWSLNSGALILFGGIGPYLILQLLWRYIKIKGLNILAFLFLGLALSSISLDAALNTSKGGLQGWSLFSFSSLILLALLFLHLHYIIKVNINFSQIMRVKHEEKRGSRRA